MGTLPQEPRVPLACPPHLVVTWDPGRANLKSVLSLYPCLGQGPQEDPPMWEETWRLAGPGHS